MKILFGVFLRFILKTFTILKTLKVYFYKKFIREVLNSIIIDAGFYFFTNKNNFT